MPYKRIRTRRVPLFDNGRNFKIGDPVNGREGYPHEGPAAQCRCDGWDYSGADPRLRWPEGWHVNPRDGKVGGGLAGDFHVNCATFAPDRLSVIHDPQKARNVLLLTGGSVARPGKVELAHWFDAGGTPRDIYHAEGIPVVLEMVFLLLPDPQGTKHYSNAELRGRLNVDVHKNEAVQCLGFHFGESIFVAYWLNAVDGSTIPEARKEIHDPVPLLHNHWYRLTMRLDPLPDLPDTWAASIVLRQPQAIVWQWQSGPQEHPNNIRHISQICGGDERGGDENGGSILIRRFEACTEVPA